MKTALITGVTGQDGTYLSELLLRRGYSVVGTSRSLSGKIVTNGVETVEVDVTNADAVASLVAKVRPDHIYHLAAQSSVGVSFAEPAQTFERLRELALDLAKRDGIQLSRFKGLGEMNAEQLWETTMDPARRRILEVRIEDAVAADNLFSILMGDAVEPRRIFIEENALNVRNLDI